MCLYGELFVTWSELEPAQSIRLTKPAGRRAAQNKEFHDRPQIKSRANMAQRPQNNSRAAPLQSRRLMLESLRWVGIVPAPNLGATSYE